MQHESSSQFPGGPSTGKVGRGGLNPKLIGLIIAAAVAIAFFFQNGGRTRIWFLLFSFTSKTRTAIIVAMALGAVMDRVFTSWWTKRRAEKAASKS